MPTTADRRYLMDFVASGANHAKGAVPDPGASAGTTKYLREDATWVDPTSTIFPVKDTDFKIKDDVDGTKTFQFQLSGITAGQNRVATVPDANFIIAGLEIANVFTANQSIVKAAGAADFTIDTPALTSASLTFKQATVTKGTLSFASATGDFGATLVANSFYLTPSDTRQNTLRVHHSDGTPAVQAGVYASDTTYRGIWCANLTPSATNYAVLSNGSTYTLLNVPNASGQFILRAANNTIATFTGAQSEQIFTLTDNTGSTGLYAGNLTGAAAFWGVWLGNKTPSSANYSVIADNNGDLFLNATAARTTYFRIANATYAQLTTAAFSPGSDGGLDLGTASLRFQDAYHSRNLFMVATSVGTNGAGVLVVGNGTAPTTSPANAFQMYSLSGAPKFRDSGGNIFTLQKSSAYTVANPTTDRALDVTGDTLAQGLAVLGTLIADLQATGLLG